MINLNKKPNTINKKILLGIFLIIICICFIFTLLVIKHNKKTTSNNLKHKHVSGSMSKKSKTTLVTNISLRQVPGEYTPWTIKRADGTKIAYLTFDDGPSINTEKILSILNQNNIKASFFLIGKNAENNPNLVKEEVANGEVIGNHTYSHQINYKESPTDFVNDLNRCNLVLKTIIGKNYTSNIIRFPGGSFGHRLAPFRDAATKAGYAFINWNDETGDSDGYDLPVSVLLNNLHKYTIGNTVVILMHDAGAKKTTVQALPQVIQYLKAKGYIFKTLQ
jgi:peptidoglycan/xylan/chitin deacetylase (PgdA/CDA1 family)